jgi:hypothetical protein
MTAAADRYCTAVALAEKSSALVSFQRHQPSIPPHKNVDSAVSPLLPACHFSGNFAQIANFAVTTATFAAFEID